MKNLKHLVVAVVTMCAAAVSAVEFQDRWFYLSGNISKTGEVERITSLVKTAGEVGLNGMLWACGMEYCDRWNDTVKARVRQVKAVCDRNGIEIIPIIWSVGYGTMLGRDPNLVASVPVTGVPYVAKETEAVFEPEAPVAFANGGFEETGKRLLPGWEFWDLPGKVSFRDLDVKRSGAASVRLEPSFEKDKHGHARLCKIATLRPNRSYRLSAWLKTEGYAGRGGGTGGIMMQVYRMKGSGFVSLSPKMKSTQDWTYVKADFNSGTNTSVRIYLGAWGGAAGKLWVDDVKLEEQGLPVIVRREGTPVTVRDAQTGTVYVEGTDYVAPPPVQKLRARDGDPSRTIRLLPGGAIKPGTRLLVDAYVPSFTMGGQTSTCMSDPRLYDYFDKSAVAIHELLKPRSWFLSMDEIRSGGTCAACAARGVDMAHQLADCLAKQRASIRKVCPDARVYVWSDMLDPAHNAHDNYFACKGTFAGVWDLMPKDLIISCWHHKKREESMAFFSSRGFRTQGAAYYDTDTLDTCRDWLDTCTRTKNCTGIMYTTWQNKYELLKPFGEMLKAAK